MEESVEDCQLALEVLCNVFLTVFLIVVGLADTYRVSEPDRVIETLQLFPLNSFGESEQENQRLHANECRDSSTMFSYMMDEQIEHPPLDLRLSFL